MTRVHPWIYVLGTLSLLALGACGLSGDGGIADPLDPGVDTNDNGRGNDPNDPDTGDPLPSDGGDGSPPGDSVADVTTGDNGIGPGANGPQSRGTIAARVRNESAFQADVTLRFIRGETLVHRAFLRVPSHTVTTIVSPESADLLELSGVDERGLALARKVLTYGVDFDESTPAEYVIPGEPAEAPPPPDDSQPPDLPPDDNGISTLTLVEPADDVTLTLGSTLLVKWTDSSGVSGAAVRISLRPAGATSDSALIPTVSTGDAVVDGIHGELRIILENLEPDLYEVVGEVDDGSSVVRSTAPGRVRVEAEPEEPVNDPPQLTLIDPAGDIEVRHGESFRVAWTDSDENDNARISLSLDPHPAIGAPDRDSVSLAPPFDEDDAQDEATLEVPVGVPRGTYRVRGEITDGLATMVTWAPGIVYFGVAPPPPPALVLTEPSVDVRTRLGRTVPVSAGTTNAPAGSVVRFYLSNRAGGGTRRVEVTHLLRNAGAELALPPTLDEMPVSNLAWPRQFKLEAELVADGVVIVPAVVAPGSIWIRQEVEIVRAAVNYTCPGGVPDSPGDRQFVGVTITWYGGGFEERDSHAEVRFWLTEDGTIPVDGLEDSRHRIIHGAPESPNAERVVQLPLRRIMSAAIREEDGLTITLEPGLYRLLTIVEPEGFGSIISGAFPDPVEVCVPSDSSGTAASR